MGSTALGIILTFAFANAQVEEHGNIPGIRLNTTILETCDITVKLEDAGITGLLRDQWVCLAEAVSERNTSKLTRMSRDPCSQYALGIFQIPNGWCFTEGREEFNKCTRNGCAIDCLKLLDNDITDDVNCIKFIHDMRGFDPWDQTKVAQCNRGVMNNQWNQTECITDRRRRGGTRTISTISLWAAILLVALSSLLVFALTYFFYKYRRNSHNVLSNQEIKEFKYGRIRGIPSIIQPRISLHEDFTTAPYNNDYEISPAEFVIDHNVRLGSGAFGVVYKATCKGKVVAAKTVNPFSSKEYLQSLLGEIKILCHIGRHNSVVNMEGAFTKELTKGKVYVFMEFCGMGSLEKFLRLNKSKYRMLEDFDDEAELNLAKSGLSIKHLLQYAHQIARGMEFLSSKKVLHGDLAARNILLVDENTAKISDFGLSRKLYGYVQYIKKKEEPLPWRWMAIESLREMNFSTASDVWMFGVLLYEIFSLGEVPYPGLSWSLDFVEKLENGFRMLKPKHAPVNIYKDVLLKCWEANPKDRPGFFDLSNYFYQMLQKITSKDYTELVENGEK